VGLRFLACLRYLDPWEDREFCGDELEGLVIGLPILRERLGEALRGEPSEASLIPPERVGFLDFSTSGIPFGREGAMRLLIELEGLVNLARRNGECLIALGD
jgi:hypothetical protein